MSRRGARFRRGASRHIAGLAVLCLCAAVAARAAQPAAQPVAQPAAAPAAPLPIDLPTALRLAGAQNLDVQIAATAVDEARANRSSALEKFLPSLTPGIARTHHEGTAQAVDGSIVDVTKSSYTTGVTLSAQVPLGEALYGVLQSRQLLAAADATLGAQRQDALLAAAQDYLELVRAAAQVGVAREALAASTSYEQQLGEAVRLGIAFRGDELRVRTQSQKLQIDVQQSEQQQQLAAARLVQTLHLDPLVRLQPADAAPLPLRLAGTDASLEALLAQARAERPEVARSRAQLAAADAARRGVLYGPAIPAIGAQAFGGEFGANRDNLGSSRDYYLGLSWRIGPGGLFDLGRIRAGDARLRAAQLADAKLDDDIARQVVQARAQVESLRAQVQLGDATVAAAGETLRLTRERKQLGVGTVLEDIQAQQELVRARTQYFSSVTDLNKAQYTLLRALGGIGAVK